MFRQIVLALALCATLAAGARSSAQIVFSRALVGPDGTDGALVAHVNTTVTYVLRNVGGAEAATVALKDLSFPASRFDMFGGSVKRSWPSLKAGESLRVVVVVRPKKAGALFVSAPSVTYVDEGVKRVGRLAVEEEFEVEDEILWRRRTEKHTGVWMLYLATVGGLSVAPFLASIALQKGLPVEAGKKKT